MWGRPGPESDVGQVHGALACKGGSPSGTWRAQSCAPHPEPSFKPWASTVPRKTLTPWKS